MNKPLSPIPLQQEYRLSPPKSGFRSIINIVCGITLLLLMLINTGCGGGSSSSAAGASGSGGGIQSGELIVGLTDAEGDFITYEVDVLSLTFTRQNGDVVETLPLTTRVDFAELTEITEFLTVATVPEGTYTSVVISMDYSNHNILVEDAAGDAVLVTPVDVQGNPLTTVDTRLSLSTSDVVRISAGVPAAFSLDFDLLASNDVDLVTQTVMVDSFLLATPELEHDREHRVRGVLDSVNTAENSFALKVRPFRHRTGQFGELTTHVDDNTQYEIDGVGFTGSEGLVALEQLAENTPVVAHGNISGSGVMADTVLAGSSVPWSDADVLVGVVAARTGDQLNLQGAHIEFADGGKGYRGTFTVNLSDDTSVSGFGLDASTLSKQSISVGQKVVMWGEFVDDVTLNAQRVRMQLNQLTAEVVQASPLAVDLFHLNGRRGEFYNFSGTGVTSTEDADPDFYEIDTLSLSLPNEGDLVRVRGIVNEFGAAPADYLARSVINVQTEMRGAKLLVAWSDGISLPFTSISDQHIAVDLSDARYALKVRGVPREFIDELTDIELNAPADGRGVYAVKVRGANEVHVYRNFSDLVDELLAQLDAGRVLHRISSQGGYNFNEVALTTARAGFTFSTPTVE